LGPSRGSKILGRNVSGYWPLKASFIQTIGNSTGCGISSLDCSEHGVSCDPTSGSTGDESYCLANECSTYSSCYCRELVLEEIGYTEDGEVLTCPKTFSVAYPSNRKRAAGYEILADTGKVQPEEYFLSLSVENECAFLRATPPLALGSSIEYWVADQPPRVFTTTANDLGHEFKICKVGTNAVDVRVASLFPGSSFDSTVTIETADVCSLLSRGKMEYGPSIYMNGMVPHIGWPALPYLFTCWPTIYIVLLVVYTACLYSGIMFIGEKLCFIPKTIFRMRSWYKAGAKDVLVILMFLPLVFGQSVNVPLAPVLPTAVSFTVPGCDNFQVFPMAGLNVVGMSASVNALGSTTLLSLTGVGSTTCLLFNSTSSSAIHETLVISLDSARVRVNPVSAYYTRRYKIEKEVTHRCRATSSCPASVTCSNSPLDFSLSGTSEYSSSTTDKPGYATCINSCVGFTGVCGAPPYSCILSTTGCTRGQWWVR